MPHSSHSHPVVFCIIYCHDHLSHLTSHTHKLGIVDLGNSDAIGAPNECVARGRDLKLALHRPVAEEVGEKGSYLVLALQRFVVAVLTVHAVSPIAMDGGCCE